MFLSTPPSRVATKGKGSAMLFDRVSIHATLAGGDQESYSQGWLKKMFLSTPPSRVATDEYEQAYSRLAFLSTPPSRVATFP